MQPPPPQQESAETTSSAWFSYTSCDNYGLCDEDDEDTCNFDGEPTAEIPSCHEYATSAFNSPMSAASGDDFMSIPSHASSFSNAATIIGFRGRVGQLTIDPGNIENNNGRKIWNGIATFGPATFDGQNILQNPATNYNDFIEHIRGKARVGDENARNTYIWIQFQFYDGTNIRNSPYLVMRVEDYYVTHFSIYNNENVVGQVETFITIRDPDYGETYTVPHGQEVNQSSIH